MVGGGVEGRDVRVVVRQLLERRRLEHQQQRVLDRGAAVAGGAVLQERAHPEGLTGADPVDQLAGLVAHLHGARADDVQPVAVVAHVEHDGAAPGVADRAPSGQRGELRGGQAVERRVGGQEVPDLGELDLHGAMVAPIGAGRVIVAGGPAGCARDRPRRRARRRRPIGGATCAVA
jgi:hypothetical protein